MTAVVGDILPLALGVAISPVPIIAAILMLLSPKAKGTSIGFLIGWVVGIVVAVTAFTVLSSVLPQKDADATNPVAGTLKLVLGVLLLLLAVKQWRGRPRGDATAALPKWMSAIDTMSPAKGLGLGFLLSAVNPKNLIMSAGAGIILGSSDLDGSQVAGVIVIYTVIAAMTVAVPVLGYLVASGRMAAPLESLRGWLLHENAVVMAVLLLVIGVVMIGKGVSSF
ncbi:GAP family protein [Angustibacter sp. McL0619]|uniref:GAP family protein n=1 Tax=Angustibacter sp. McL0619 TaxID=3415676 RepID=UPI003CE6806C